MKGEHFISTYFHWRVIRKHLIISDNNIFLFPFFQWASTSFVNISLQKKKTLYKQLDQRNRPRDRYSLLLQTDLTWTIKEILCGNLLKLTVNWQLNFRCINWHSLMYTKSLEFKGEYKLKNKHFFLWKRENIFCFLSALVVW